MSISSILISPPTTSLKLAPGETYSGELTVLNPSDATEKMTFVAEVSPYSVVEPDYSADFSSETKYTNIANWLTLEKTTGTLAPGESINLKYTINVPENAPAGGQYCSIAVRNVNNGTDTVNEVFEIASLIFARISGEVVESGEIISVSTPSIVLALPVKTSLTLKNSGNVHLNAKISTKVTSFFTGETILPLSEDEYQTETVMPETTRYATYTYNEFPELGLFNFTQDITYAGKTKTESHLIFICPIWFLILTILAIGAVAYLLFVKILKRKHKDISL